MVFGWLAALAALAGALALWALWYAPSHVVLRIKQVELTPRLASGADGPVGAILRGLEAQLVATVMLDVENDNVVGARLDELTYEVHLNGRAVGSGEGATGPNGLLLGAGETTPMVVETRFPALTLLSTGIDAATGGALLVDVKGRARFSILGIPLSRDFELRRPAAVTATLADLLQAAPPRVDAQR
jgi:hypothetical protein